MAPRRCQPVAPSVPQGISNLPALIAQRLDQADCAAGFSHLTEAPTQPGYEANAHAISKFNSGQSRSTDVLRITSSCLNKLGGNWNAALACLQALSQCKHPNTGEVVVPNTFVYNAAMSVCGKAARTDKALALLKHLRQHGSTHEVFPDLITYNTAISACAKTGSTDAALELFDQLRAESADRGLFPNKITYSALITACEKAGRTDKVLELFDQLCTEGPAHGSLPDAIAYSAAIAACEKAGRTQDYGELLLRGIHGLADRPGTAVFRSDLGFNLKLNRLDLKEEAVLTRCTPGHSRGCGVHPAVARAIFNVLLSEPEKILGQGAQGINDRTEFVVGQHGGDTVKSAIQRCMREQGWTAVHPISPSDGRPNEGRLVARGV